MVKQILEDTFKSKNDIILKGLNTITVTCP